MNAPSHLLSLGDVTRVHPQRSLVKPAPILALLFLVSLFLPAIDVQADYELFGSTSRAYIPLDGWDCLMLWPDGLVIAWWWPNALFLIGLTMLVMKRPKVAYICGKLATAFAASVTVLVAIYFDGLATGHGADSGFRFPLRVGYFVWLSCMIGLMCSARHAMSKNVTGTNPNSA